MVTVLTLYDCFEDVMNEHMSCIENTPGTFTARTETRAVGFLSPRSLGSLKVKGGSPGKVLGQCFSSGEHSANVS